MRPWSSHEPIHTGASDILFLGIEIGGTKLAVGVGAGDGSPSVALANG